MPSTENSFISREVWPYLGLIAVLALLVQYYFGFIPSIWVWVSWVGLAYVFRDPKRSVTSEPLAIVCPVDACITSIDTISHPYLQGETICMVLKMNRFGAYRVRSPMEGKVMQQWLLLPGDSLPMLQGAVGMLHISYWIQSDEGDDVVLSMRKTSRLFSPQCRIQVGERIGQGQRCGMIPLGSQVVIYLPVNATLNQEKGACLKAGSDVLAYLRREPDRQ